MLRNGFVLNPPKELKPDLKLSPFSTADIAMNRDLPDSDLIEIYFKERFGSKSRCYTASGREALNLALSNYNLASQDIVTIFTTTCNKYVSGCVTGEIGKFCKWSREIETGTKVILVIHEFGIPFRDLGLIKKYNIPIIEDCAYSFFSGDEKNETGNIGDYVIYSFPKIFPMQAGGMLISNSERLTPKDNNLELIKYIRKSLSFHINKRNWIIETRKKNHRQLNQMFRELGFIERFDVNDNKIPGVFMFRTEKEGINLPGLKEFLYENGIECSVFYGEDSFFIPVHQNLSEADILYMYEAVKYYKSTQNANL